MDLSFIKLAEKFADIDNVNIPERGDCTFSIDGNDFKIGRLSLIDSDKLINKSKKVLSKYQSDLLSTVSVDSVDYSEQEAGVKIMALIDSMFAQDDVNELKYELCFASMIKVNDSYVSLRENLINTKIKSRDDLMAIALVYLEVNAAGFFSQRLITSLLQRAQTAD